MPRSLLALGALFIAGESLLSAPAVAGSLSLAPMLQRVVPSVVSISVQGKQLDDADATLAGGTATASSWPPTPRPSSDFGEVFGPMRSQGRSRA